MRRYQDRARLLPVILLVGLLLACIDSEPSPTPATTAEVTPSGTPSAATPQSTSSAALEPTPTLVPPVAQPFPEELSQEANAILSRLADIRGLTALGDIGMNLIGRGAASDFYRANVTVQERETYRIQSNLYALLGMVPEDTDILDSLLSLLGLGIAGFYSTDLQAFYLVDDLGGLSSRASQQTIVHELVHALQDQHYDLNRLGEEREANWDALAAFFSVVEGDAVFAETAYFGASLRSRPNCFSLPPFSQLFVPYVVVREINSRYDDGVCFVEKVGETLAQDREEIFLNPPASTEQILHPQKYLAQEAPLEVELPSLAAVLGPQYQLVESSTFGELGLQNLLIPGLSDEPGAVLKAAAGWGGDAWAYFEDEGGGRLVHFILAWDSQADADEFWAALQDSLNNRSARTEEIDDGVMRAELGGNLWLAIASPLRTTLLVSDDADALERAAASLEQR